MAAATKFIAAQKAEDDSCPNIHSCPKSKVRWQLLNEQKTKAAWTEAMQLLWKQQYVEIAKEVCRTVQKEATGG